MGSSCQRAKRFDPGGEHRPAPLDTGRKASAGVLTALLCWIGVVATGCPSEEPEPPELAGGADLSALADLPPREVLIAMREERRRIQNAPGRVGILAEEPRYSLFLEELIIRDFFQDRQDGFFVDVGCAWPIKASNTYYLEKHLGWTGIGIDALPDFAAPWEQKRPGSRFFAFLISDQIADKTAFYKSQGLGLSSVDREHASGRSFGTHAEPEEIEVPMTTLDALLDAQGVTEVDLLSLDIEGHEPAALRGFDIDRFQPELVVVEGRDPEVLAFLVAHGYRMLGRYAELDRVNSYFRPKARRGPRTPGAPPGGSRRATRFGP